MSGLTTHELGRLLLSKPDVPAVIMGSFGSYGQVVKEVKEVKFESFFDGEKWVDHETVAFDLMDGHGESPYSVAPAYLENL